MLPLAPPAADRLDPLFLLLAALLLDAIFGDFAPLFRRVPHPVALLGRLIQMLERRLNRPAASGAARRVWGGLAAAMVVALAAAAGFLLDRLAGALPGGDLIVLAVLTLLLAQRSLYDHVAAVRHALDREGVAAGREAVGHIVGRNPQALDAHGIARAAIESLAENFGDGVVAPVFWFLLLGLPGICAYKAANTLDSMLGHRSPRYRAFGWASARLDDLLNLVPARLAGALIALAALVMPGAHGSAAVETMRRDARKHNSPNAGFPESAMAGAIGSALAGPRRYGEELVELPWLGTGRAHATADDIGRALAIYVGACLLEAALIAAPAALRLLW